VAVDGVDAEHRGDPQARRQRRALYLLYHLHPRLRRRTPLSTLPAEP
jgi:hypothetical protein